MENVKKMIDISSSKISYIFRFLKKRFHIKINTNSVLEHIIVLELYTLLTILAFHKLFILGIDKVLIGDGSDAYQHIWNFWWVKKAILESKDIFYTDYLFYPIGSNLYFHSLSLYNSGAAFILNLVLNIDFITIYNLLLLSTFIFSGIISYVIFKHLGADIYLSFALSFAFTFSSFHIIRTLGHLDLSTIYLLPPFFYFLIRYDTDKIKNSSLKKIFLYSFVISVLLFLNFLNSYYFAILLSISLPLLLVIDIIITMVKGEKAFFKIVLFYFLIFLFFSIFLSNFLLSSINNYDAYYLERSLEDLDKYAANIRDYIIPHKFSLLYNLVNVIKLNLNVPDHIDRILSIPISLLVLFFVSIIQVYTLKRKEKISAIDLKLVILILFYFSISLGPIINVKNIEFYSPLYMIYYHFYPFFKAVAFPSRASILVFALICIFISRNLSLDKKYSIILLTFLFIEQFPIFYYYYEHIHIPSFMYSLKNDNTFFTILNIPPEFQNSKAMFYQTIHEKKILDGYLSRTPWKTSKKILMDLRYLVGIRNTNGILEIFSNLNTKYIILYKDLPRNVPYFLFDEFEEILNLIPNTKIYEDDKIIVFKIDDKYTKNH